MTHVRRARSEDLTERERSSLRALFADAWPEPDDAFDEDDWGHALGGVHFFVAGDDGEIVSHASVVPRELQTNGRTLRTGYVEAVATRSTDRRRGLGTAVVRAATEHIEATYELGALGTGEHGFYERLGWVTWRGPTSVRLEDGDRRTRDEDGFVMVHRTSRSPELDLDAPISCDPRPGDAW